MIPSLQDNVKSLLTNVILAFDKQTNSLYATIRQYAFQRCLPLLRVLTHVPALSQTPQEGVEYSV